MNAPHIPLSATRVLIYLITSIEGHAVHHTTYPSGITIHAPNRIFIKRTVGMASELNFAKNIMALMEKRGYRFVYSVSTSARKCVRFNKIYLPGGHRFDRCEISSISMHMHSAILSQFASAGTPTRNHERTTMSAYHNVSVRSAPGGAIVFERRNPIIVSAMQAVCPNERRNPINENALTKYLNNDDSSIMSSYAHHGFITPGGDLPQYIAYVDACASFFK